MERKWNSIYIDKETQAKLETLAQEDGRRRVDELRWLIDKEIETREIKA